MVRIGLKWQVIIIYAENTFKTLIREFEMGIMFGTNYTNGNWPLIVLPCDVSQEIETRMKHRIDKGIQIISLEVQETN